MTIFSILFDFFQVMITPLLFLFTIEISNPGSLPKELNIAQLKDPQSSYPHNPTLGNCMFLTGAIERFGTGIPEMHALPADRGLKALDIEDNKTFLVTLWRPFSITAHDTVHDQHIFLEELPKRLIWVLEEEKSRNDLMEIVQLKHNPTFRESYIEPAMVEGGIEMTIPGKPTSQKQRYRLSEAGAAEKEKNAKDSKLN